jgi:hypothetical protein
MKKGKKMEENQEVRINIPEECQRAFMEIVDLTDAFCREHLNEDYRQFCINMAIALCQIDVPINKGRPVSWASGIVHALGMVNFLQDPAQSPHMTSSQIAEGFGVSQQTMQAKSKIIRDELDLIQLDPDWCLPSLLKDNPLVWMLEVNGFIMDIRMAPREAQEEAYRQGLIPYIPDDQEEPETDSNAEIKIIEFPSPDHKSPEPESIHEPKIKDPTLFDELNR